MIRWIDSLSLVGSQVSGVPCPPVNQDEVFGLYFQMFYLRFCCLFINQAIDERKSVMCKKTRERQDNK